MHLCICALAPAPEHPKPGAASVSVGLEGQESWSSAVAERQLGEAQVQLWRLSLLDSARCTRQSEEAAQDSPRKRRKRLAQPTPPDAPADDTAGAAPAANPAGLCAACAWAGSSGGHNGAQGRRGADWEGGWVAGCGRQTSCMGCGRQTSCIAACTCLSTCRTFSFSRPVLGFRDQEQATGATRWRRAVAIAASCPGSERRCACSRHVQ